MEDIKIIHHNVLKWTGNRASELYNIYRLYDPDLILLNSTGKKQEEKIKLFGYKVYQKNYYNENSAGIAMAIKPNIKHKIIDHYNGDILGMELETNKGKITVATAYIPPRRNLDELQSLISMARKTMPTYFFADLNARHRVFGYNDNNNMGKALEELIRRNILTYLGPEFKTFITRAHATSPDIALGNRFAHLNITIQQGPITTSDHIPMYIRLATKPIASKKVKTWKIHKADWGKFTNYLNANMERVQSDYSNEFTTQQVDEELNKWFVIMAEAMKEAIPTSDIITMPSPKITNRQNI